MSCCEGAGKPLPAGAGLDRRQFLARGAGLAAMVYGSTLLKPGLFEDGIAAAQAGGPGRVLVSVYCNGGLDAMTLLAPNGHADYARLRGGLAVARDPALAFADDPTLQWHPAAAPLRDLHAAGRLTVLPAVGYSDPNQSHFTSQHYWETGALDPSGRTGWMGRLLDLHGSATNPLQGLALGWGLAPALAPGRVPVAAVSEPGSYDFWTRDVWDADIVERLLSGWGALGDLPAASPALAQARGAAAMSTALRAGLSPLRGTDPLAGARVPYPSSDDAFPRRLATLAQMLELGLPLRCVAIDANGGYDTHDDQAATLPRDIGLLSQALAAFQADLEARGLADRVLVHLWSEFGRRAEGNGSGTDHGAAGLSLVMGTQARGGMVGEFPGIARGELDRDGNLRHTSDFRALYKTLCEGWFDVDAAPIVPDAGRFDALPLLR